MYVNTDAYINFATYVEKNYLPIGRQTAVPRLLSVGIRGGLKPSGPLFPLEESPRAGNPGIENRAEDGARADNRRMKKFQAFEDKIAIGPASGFEWCIDDTPTGHTEFRMEGRLRFYSCHSHLVLCHPRNF